jgi:hypothetical protein
LGGLSSDDNHDEQNYGWCSGGGLKRQNQRFDPKDSNSNVLSCIQESKNHMVWPTGDFWRFGEKSLNRICGGDGQKSLGK